MHACVRACVHAGVRVCVCVVSGGNQTIPAAEPKHKLRLLSLEDQSGDESIRTFHPR